MNSKINNIDRCMGKISYNSDLNSHFPLHFEIIIKFTDLFLDNLLFLIVRKQFLFEFKSLYNVES